MKTNSLKRFRASIALCMFAIFSLSFVSCSDNDEVTMMEDDKLLEETNTYYKFVWANWYNNPELNRKEIVNWKSMLQYDEIIGKWTLNASDTSFPEGIIIILDDIKEDWKQYINEEETSLGYFFTVSGSCSYQYSIMLKSTTDDTDCYEPEISNYYKINGEKIELSN